MTWLIVIVRLGRAAPRHRRRVLAGLGDAGAVPVSNRVWAIPDTGFHRAAVNAAGRLAVSAGGDIVIMTTSAENGPSLEILETTLAERLTAEAAAIIHRCDQLAARAGPGALGGPAPGDRAQEFMALERDVQRLTRIDVIGLESVASAAARVADTVRLPGTNDAA